MQWNNRDIRNAWPRRMILFCKEPAPIGLGGLSYNRSEEQAKWKTGGRIYSLLKPAFPPLLHRPYRKTPDSISPFCIVRDSRETIGRALN